MSFSLSSLKSMPRYPVASHIDHPLRNLHDMSTGTKNHASKISQIFKQFSNALFNNKNDYVNSFSLDLLQEAIFLAYFMKHCYEKSLFHVDQDPYAQVFEMNCKQFILILEIHRISSKEKKLILSGDFTWKHLQTQKFLPLSKENYLAHLINWIFFSSTYFHENEMPIENSDDEEEYKDALESPCKNKKPDKYKKAVLLFVKDILKYEWEIITSFSKEEIREFFISSPLMQNILSKILMRGTVELLKKHCEHNIKLDCLRNLNYFIYHFNNNHYTEWSKQIKYLLANMYKIDEGCLAPNLLQFTCHTLMQYFHHLKEDRSILSVYLTKMHYLLLLFFLDQIDVLSLNSIFARFHSEYFLPIATALSEISIERICTGVLIHFHPTPPHNCLRHIFIKDLPHSKKQIQDLPVQSLHVIGINQILTAIFCERENELPPVFRRSKMFKNCSKFTLSFILDHLEIKTVRVSKTLFHFLRCTSYEYLIALERKTMYFWFQQYFNLSEFQKKGEERPLYPLHDAF